MLCSCLATIHIYLFESEIDIKVNINYNDTLIDTFHSTFDLFFVEIMNEISGKVHHLCTHIYDPKDVF